MQQINHLLKIVQRLSYLNFYKKVLNWLLSWLQNSQQLLLAHQFVFNHFQLLFNIQFSISKTNDYSCINLLNLHQPLSSCTLLLLNLTFQRLFKHLTLYHQTLTTFLQKRIVYNICLFQAKSFHLHIYTSATSMLII